MAQMSDVNAKIIHSEQENDEIKKQVSVFLDKIQMDLEEKYQNMINNLSNQQSKYARKNRKSNHSRSRSRYRSRSRSPRKSRKSNRSRSRSRNRKSHKRSRSRSRSPRKDRKINVVIKPQNNESSPLPQENKSISPDHHENFNITAINNVSDGNWLRHFYLHGKKLLDLMGNNNPINITMYSGSEIINHLLDRANICDLADLYQNRECLCKYCYNGENLSNSRLLCKNCLMFYQDVKCKSISGACQGIKFIDKKTYSTYIFCKNCYKCV